MIFHNPLQALRTAIDAAIMRRARLREEKLRVRVSHEVQVGEYDGSLYVTFRGVPIVCAGELATSSGDGKERDLPAYVAGVRRLVEGYYREIERQHKL